MESFSVKTAFRLVKQMEGFAVLFCLTFASLSSFAFDSPRSPDLVFCPLQKQWVKKSESPRPQIESPLSGICAGIKDKTSFTKKLAFTRRAAVKIEADALFFDYQARGNRAFAEIPSVPNAPDAPEASLGRNQIAINAGRDDFPPAIAPAFSLNRLSRPPTSEPAVNFAPLPHRVLSPISHSTAPRGPPVSL